MISRPDPDDDLFYPDTDGRPMAESDFQREPLAYAVSALRRHFHAEDDVYVSGNLLIYYEQGNPKASVAPDVFVVRGAPRHDRRTYKLWEEPKAPDFVLEITSRSTVSEDQGTKRGLYAFLGIDEYWQFDPTGDYLVPPLKGLRLIDGNYWPIQVREDNGGLVGVSDVLGLGLRSDVGELHFYDPASGRTLLNYGELEQAREHAEARADAEAHERQVAEARADAEARQREVAEARIAELEARLRKGD